MRKRVVAGLVYWLLCALVMGAWAAGLRGLQEKGAPLVFYAPVAGPWADRNTDLLRLDWGGASHSRFLKITLFDMHGGVFAFTVPLRGPRTPGESELELPLSAFVFQPAPSAPRAFSTLHPEYLAKVQVEDETGTADDFHATLEFGESEAHCRARLAATLQLIAQLAGQLEAPALELKGLQRDLQRNSPWRSEPAITELAEATAELQKALAKLSDTESALRRLPPGRVKRLDWTTALRKLQPELARRLRTARTASDLRGIIKLVSGAQRTLDEASVEALGGVLREGASYHSFGEFGWRDDFGTGFFALQGRKLVFDAGKAKASIEFLLPGFAPRKPPWEAPQLPDITPSEYAERFDWRLPLYGQAARVNWTLSDLEYTFAAPSGNASLRLLASACSPGVLVQPQASQLTLKLGGALARLQPAKYSFHTRDGVQESAGSTLAASLAAALDRNWLVVRFGAGLQGPALLLVFQHRPQAVAYADGALKLTWQGPCGTLGVAPWRPAPGGKLSTQAEVAGRLLFTYPVQGHEYYAVRGGTVWFMDAYDYLVVKDDFGTAALYAAPLPPWVARAFVRKLGVEVYDQLHPMPLQGRLGPAYYAAGDTVEWSVPLPRGGHYLALRPGFDARLAEDLDDLARAWLDDQEDFATRPLVQPSEATLGGWSQVAQLWSFLSKGSKWRLHDKWTRFGLSALVRQSWRLRVEPFSGHQYYVCGEWGRLERPGDLQPVGLEIARTLYGLANYARYTGNWDSLAGKRGWLERLSSYLLRASGWAWPVAGLYETGGGASGNLLLNEYGAALALSKLGEGLHDSKLADSGWYLVARLSVAMLERFEGFNYDDIQGQATCTPTLADYSESEGFSTQPATLRALVAPEVLSPEAMDLYVQACPLALNRLAELELQRAGGWMQVRGRDSEFFPLIATQVALSADPDRVRAIFTARHGRLPGLQWLPQFAWALGYRSPVNLVEWMPGYLEDARYRLEFDGLELQVATRRPFTLLARMPQRTSWRYSSGSSTEYRPFDERARLLVQQMPAGFYKTYFR